MRLITLIGSALGVVRLCEGVAVAERGSAPDLAARAGWDNNCRRDDKCLNALFNYPTKAEYICKKLLHRPQTIYTTKYIPSTTTTYYTVTHYTTKLKTIYKPVMSYLHPIVNKRNEPAPETSGSDIPEPTGTVSAQAVPAIVGDPEPAAIPDEALFAGRDPYFSYCTTIDQLKKACECFLDYKHVPKYVVKTVYVTKIIVKKKFVDTTVTKTVTKTIAQPLVIKNAANCFRRYKPTQPIPGADTSSSIVPNIDSALACCQKCAATNNCIAAAWGSNTYYDLYLDGSPFGASPNSTPLCRIVVQTKILVGAPTVANCPYGSRNIEFGPVNNHDSVFAGPCGY